jgi:hypothetical protein
MAEFNTLPTCASPCEVCPVKGLPMDAKRAVDMLVKNSSDQLSSGDISAPAIQKATAEAGYNYGQLENMTNIADAAFMIVTQACLNVKLDQGD